MTAALACGSCGAEPRAGARFCDACGKPIAASAQLAEYKQVTLLFADVARSMDIAAALGPERLREVMGAVFDRCAQVVKRYGGTVDKFTGDGIMAIFGAPTALEDHAFRACLAALDIQGEAGLLAADIDRRDGVTLQVRVGLNSGQVIAGEIGSSTAGYTAVGEQVGMAQRMESVAPPGGVMLSESTAQLVDGHVGLGQPEQVRIKGSDSPVIARRLIDARARGGAGRQVSTLVGRDWEMSAIAGILDRAIAGTGCAVSVMGPPGIGKSRFVSESTRLATARGVDVYPTFCESHATEIPFNVVTRLLRAVFGIGDLAPAAARQRVRAVLSADPEDALLVDDFLGIKDADTATPDIDADARRRRITNLLNSASLARSTPAVYVIEDAHWIDGASDSLLAELMTVISRTRSVVLITYRPEFRGALSRIAGAQTIALAPLSEAETVALISEMLGADQSLHGLDDQICERAAGNPFFAEEIVRDLAEGGVLEGRRGAYRTTRSISDVRVPPSLQAAIAARIDRLGSAAKRTINAASVVGSRFGPEALSGLVDEPAFAELVGAELIDQVTYTSRAEYAFRHPLIRTVAYESQLMASRTALHRRLAHLIADRDSPAVDQDAGVIAEHFEAAGDLPAAFEWHMRAGRWLTERDFRAARVSWRRARDAADRLPADYPDRGAMRISPRTILCGGTWRVCGDVADTGFDELQALCEEESDRFSILIGVAGKVSVLTFHGRFREAARLVAEYRLAVEDVDEPVSTILFAVAASNAKFQAGEMIEGLRWAQRAIDVAEGDFTKGGGSIFASPFTLALSLRGSIRSSLGLPGGRTDLDRGVELARQVDTTSYLASMLLRHTFAVWSGLLRPDAIALDETEEALQIAEQSGDDFALCTARLCHGLNLFNRADPRSDGGIELIDQVRTAIVQQVYPINARVYTDTASARQKARLGDADGAIDDLRAITDFLYDTGEMLSRGPTTTLLVESLLQRGEEVDIAEAQTAIERLAAVPTDPGLALHELPLLRLRALIAATRGDHDSYRDFRDRYRVMANDLDFEGHIAIAEAMD